MTYSTTTYEFTAFAEADLLSGGDHNLGCGDTFTMPGSASVCISVSDNDPFLSGDCRDNARDHYGQQAAIETAGGDELGNGGQIYAESYFWVKDAAGNWYVMIEIEQEGSNDDYFTFYNGSGYSTPPAGAELTVYSQCNVKGNWVDYKCLDAGEKTEPAEPTGSISGTVFCDIDCDGVQDVEITYDKGNNIFTDSVTFESVTCTTYNANSYGSWYSVGADVIDLVVGSSQGHYGNAHDNTLVELDKGGVWCRQFDVTDAGKYCLTLDIFKNSCIPTGDNKFEIKINGVTVEVVTVNADGSIEVELDLAAGNNRIDFVSLSTTWGYGAGIDNIELLPLVEVVNTVEPAKEGVLIKLLNADGSAVLDDDGNPVTTTTDADGNYSFDNVPVGDYKIMGVAPDGTEFTIQDAGSDDSIDSDVDASGTSGVVTVTDGSTTDIDLGVCEKEPGSLSGTYFCDENRDGDDDGAANGDLDVAGKTVMLFLADGVTPATDIDGNPVAAAITDGNGDYSFSNLAAGDYVVMFEAESGKEFIAANAAADDVDSDVVDTVNGKTAPVTVIAGEETTDVDAGVQYQPGAISGTYFCDENRDAVDAGNANGDLDVAGKTVMLFLADGVTPATDIDGNPVAAAITDGNGDYSFANLAAGDYVVQFEDSAAEGKRFVAPDANQSSTQDSVDDSDVLGTDGKTAPVTVVAGQTTENVDAGVEYLPGSLSGRYFCDDDGDGLDNDGPDNGVEGVEVALLDSSGNPVLDGNSQPVTTTTDSLGNYAFTGLLAGTYGVLFTDAVSGKELTTQNVDMDASDDIDSDAGDAGRGQSIITDIVVVAGQDTPDNDAGVVEPNEEPIAIDDAGEGCADELITIDLSDNFSDDDSASVGVTMVDGQMIADTGTIVVNGTATLEGGGTLSFTGLEITRDGDEFIFNGESAFASLDIGEKATASISFKVEDSDGGAATGGIDITFCGDANTLASFCDSLPDTPVEYQLVSSAVEAPYEDTGFDLMFGDTGDARFDGTLFEQAYCISILDPAAVEESFATAPINIGDMFCAADATADVFNANQVSVANGQSAFDNLDLVSWILNQDYENNGFSGWEVQRAIWELTDSFDTNYLDAIDPAFGEDADVDFIVGQAIANGEGFQAGVGDIVGVIIDPNPVLPENSQPFIVAMNFEDFDCLC